MAEAEHVIRRAGGVRLMLSDAQVSLMRVLVQPIEDIGRLTHCRREHLRMHRATPSARTADQTEIAYFWWESSPLKWSRIARTVSANSGFSPWQNARLREGCSRKPIGSVRL